jgi:hypothetical protein
MLLYLYPLWVVEPTEEEHWPAFYSAGGRLKPGIPRGVVGFWLLTFGEACFENWGLVVPTTLIWPFDVSLDNIILDKLLLVLPYDFYWFETP